MLDIVALFLIFLRSFAICQGKLLVAFGLGEVVCNGLG
jgi:hypothetical protein